jgi:hypothetical protein
MTMKLPSLRSHAAIAVAAAAILTVGLTGTASAATGSVATGGPAPQSQPVPAPYPGAVPAPDPGAGAVLPTLLPAPVTGSGAAPAAACTPYVDGDYAHLSSGDVSSHGWWYQGSCPFTKVTVTIGLQEYFSDGIWRNKGTIGSAYVYPGGGSARRATARDLCVGVALAAWRSYVRVSIGTGASAYTPAQNLNCTD